MKRVFMTLVSFWLFFLLPLTALGGEEALFPAYGENGMWGYIDRTGAWVIPPQFDYAGEFRGNYAAVSVLPEGMERDGAVKPWEYHSVDGVIDRTGAFVLPPLYDLIAGQSGDYFGGKDTGIWLVTRYADWDGDFAHYRTGFFDVSSGCFSGLKWRNVWHWVSDSRLIPVMDGEGAGYADRTTGEMVIPCQYYDLDPAVFREGVAVVGAMDEDHFPLDFFLMDETGAVIPLPDSVTLDYAFEASEGLVTVMDDERLTYGFADLQGNVVIPPQFLYAGDFQDGYAAVWFPERDWGYIDRTGTVVHRGIPYDSDWWGPERANGVYVLQTGEREATAWRVTGEKLFSVEGDLEPPMKNGLCWLCRDGLWGLVDLAGQIVSEPQWDLASFQSMEFPEGLQLVGKDGQWGFIDETGAVVIPPIYDDAENFSQGLAWVRLGEKCGYIDREGREIFFWNAE